MSSYVICVFGAGGVGKSCLTLRFTQNYFEPKYNPTIEDVYTAFDISLQTIEVDEKNYSLEILDTAGSEEFSTMRDLYVQKADGFVLVYSIVSQATFNDLDSYYSRIKNSRASGTDVPPMVLVGNKVDLASERVVSRDAGQTLAKNWNCSFFETSTKDRINVNEVFYELVRKINQDKQQPVSANTNLQYRAGEGLTYVKSTEQPSSEDKETRCCCTIQ